MIVYDKKKKFKSYKAIDTNKERGGVWFFSKKIF
jgi:hypothetical protein